MTNVDAYEQDYDPEVKEAVKRFTKLKKENERLQVELGQAQMRASEFEGANKQLKINLDALKRSRDFYMSRLVEFQTHFESVSNVVRAADSLLTKVSEYQQSKSELPPTVPLGGTVAIEDDDILGPSEEETKAEPPKVNVTAIAQRFGFDRQQQEEPKQRKQR